MTKVTPTADHPWKRVYAAPYAPERLAPMHSAANKRRATQRAASIRKDEIDGIKDVPCVDCGNEYPAECMDFDHVPERGPKLFGIGDARHRNREEVLAEIAKCDIVCANCHRIRTRRRRYQ